MCNTVVYRRFRVDVFSITPRRYMNTVKAAQEKNVHGDSGRRVAKLQERKRGFMSITKSSGVGRHCD